MSTTNFLEREPRQLGTLHDRMACVLHLMYLAGLAGGSGRTHDLWHAVFDLATLVGSVPDAAFHRATDAIVRPTHGMAKTGIPRPDWDSRESVRALAVGCAIDPPFSDPADRKARAIYAEAALTSYTAALSACRPGEADIDEDTRLVDLLIDLRHLAAARGISFERLNRFADEDYNQEHDPASN